MNKINAEKSKLIVLSKVKVTDEELKRLWLEERISLRKIAPIAGVSAQYVKRLLNGMGIETSKASIHYDLICKRCGKIFNRVRRYKDQKYCSNECHGENLRDKNYRESKKGTVAARKIVSKYFELKRGYIVHHCDQDQTNNELSNLWVFRNSSDHQKWHWKPGRTDVTPLWKGSNPPRVGRKMR